MGFVKTREEIARLEQIVSNPRFVNAEMLQIDFLTDPATVARLLPPTLQPVDTPLVTASVGRWQSNCAGDFEGGAVHLAAKHGDIEAGYVLAMYMNWDAPIIFGREVFGEPKKLARMGMNHRGTAMSGWVERYGRRIFELSAELGPDLGPSRSKSANFNIKVFPATNGIGLQGDAILTLAEYDVDLSVNRIGSGSVSLFGGPHDPLQEIEVGEIVRAAYVEGHLISKASDIGKIPAQEYLPYYYGRIDDWSLLDTEACAG